MRPALLLFAASTLVGCTQMAALPSPLAVREGGGGVTFEHYVVGIPAHSAWFVRSVESEVERMTLVAPDLETVEVSRVSEDGEEVAVVLTRRGGLGDRDERSLMESTIGLALGGRVGETEMATESLLEGYLLRRIQRLKEEGLLTEEANPRPQFYTAEVAGALSFAYTDLVVGDPLFPYLRVAARVVESNGTRYIVRGELAERVVDEGRRDFLGLVMARVEGR